MYTTLCCFLYYSLIVFDIEERVNVFIMYSTSRLLTEHIILVIVYSYVSPIRLTDTPCLRYIYSPVYTMTMIST